VSTETVAWIAAGGAVAGAAIGSAVGGVVRFVLDYAGSRGKAKAGARLVRLELALAASRLNDAENEQQWWRFYTTSMEAWDRYDDVLARRLSSDDFDLVTQSVGELADFGDQMRRAMDTHSTAPWIALSDKQVEAMHTARSNATAAYNALAKRAKQEKVNGLLHAPPAGGGGGTAPPR
jgi:hypothetical protein